MSTPMQVRDITQRDLDAIVASGRVRVAHGDESEIERTRLARALAVAVEALREHEWSCDVCSGLGTVFPHDGTPDCVCAACDGTGSNPARRALDTTIDTQEAT